MSKIKHLLTAVVILSVVIAGILGVALVLDLVSAEATKQTMVKLLQIFAIITLVTGAVIGVLHINKQG